MRADFFVMDQHIDAPRAPSDAARLVLSRLGPGSTAIGASGLSLKMVLEGEELYRIDGRDIRVRAGEFLYLDAGADCIGTNRTATTGMCLMLPRAPAAPPPPAETARDDLVLGRVVGFSAQTTSLGRALHDYGRRIARNPEAGTALASEIIARVRTGLAEPLAESGAAIANLKTAKPSTRRELYQRLDRARGHLHDHTGRAVTLGELASVAGLSQFHLARYFKLAFGEAPIAYHRSLRLDRAAQFLAAGEGSVAQAAELAGYSDAVALSHAFRKRFGCAPQRYAMGARD